MPQENGTLNNFTDEKCYKCVCGKKLPVRITGDNKGCTVSVPCKQCGNVNFITGKIVVSKPK